jgi:hypothetical protein
MHMICVIRKSAAVPWLLGLMSANTGKGKTQQHNLNFYGVPFDHLEQYS